MVLCLYNLGPIAATATTTTTTATAVRRATSGDMTQNGGELTTNPATIFLLVKN
jgi:hypothetical protein